MNLGTVMALVGAVVLFLAVPVYLVLWDGFKKLESREAVKSVEHARAALDSSVVRLSRLAEDWAYWNDNYATLRGEGLHEREEYLSRNLARDHFETAYFHLLYLTRSDGMVVWGRSFDPGAGDFVALDAMPGDALAPEHPLLKPSTPTAPVSGLLRTERGLMTVASYPAKLSDGGSTPRGRLILGRFLTDEDLGQVNEGRMARLEAVPLGIGSAELPTQKARAGTDMVDASEDGALRVLEPQSEVSALAELTIEDVFGQPALLLRARSAGEVLQFAESALRYAGLIFVLALWVVLTAAMVIAQRYGIVRRGSLYEQSLEAAPIEPVPPPAEVDEAGGGSTFTDTDTLEGTDSYGDTWIDDEGYASAAWIHAGDKDGDWNGVEVDDGAAVADRAQHSRRNHPERRRGAKRAGVDPSTVTAAVFLDGIRMMYRTAEVTIAFTAVGVCGIIAMLIGEVPGVHLLGWFGLAAIVISTRIIHLMWRRRHNYEAEPTRLSLEMTLGSLAVGVVVGGGFAWMNPYMSMGQQAVYAVAIVGFAAGAATSMAAHRPTFFAYLLPMFVPLAATCFFNAYTKADPEQAILGVFALAFGAVLSLVNAFNHDATRSSLTLRYEKDDLLSQLEESNEALLEDRQLFLHASLTDSLTGVPNRRHFDQLLGREWKRCLRMQAPISCVLFDIDYFKAFNDRYGHEQGDRCLRKVGRSLRSLIKRSADLPARYGGEEFAVVLPQTPLAGARALAEEIRARIEGLRIAHAASKASAYVTVSVGVACVVPQRGSHPSELVRFADEALYVAKNDGRNRIHVRALAAVNGPSAALG
ncbi:MAG: diguanylate cyclase [Gammaproteobacteria bacterium]